MSFQTILSLMGFAVLAVLVPFQAQAQGNPNPSSSVDAFILDEMEAERFPGAATVIVKDGKIVWLQSYGFADVENSVPVQASTVFMLASISKVFTGTAAMQLRENNLIGLDQDVNAFLPWALQIPDYPSEPISFRQLMTHTASIVDNYDFMDTYYDYPDPSISLADCMQRYFSENGADYDPFDNFLPFEPGTTFEYSNIATALNGYLVERVSGMPFNEYSQEHIFGPLCMENTSWFFADFDSSQLARPYQFTGGNYVPYAHYGFADYPSGQLRSNVLDMANFMMAYLNGGSLESSSILSAASIQEMWTFQVPDLEPTMGLNWYQEELFHSGGTSWLWGHNGGEQGVSTDMYLDPVNNIGICVLTNGEGDALFICDELYDYALSLGNAGGITPACAPTSLEEVAPAPVEKTVFKIYDVLGRETPIRPNTPLIRVFTDGSVERFIIFE